MPIYLLPEESLIFPHPEFGDENGIVAIGGDLNLERLLLAYRFGIFPWYNKEEPILWWSPDPRMVLFPEKIKIQKSMRSYFNQRKFTCTIDQNFEAVISNCKNVQRHGQQGTWITEEMEKAYIDLHRAGYAHSLEVWKEGILVGGLYGISLGKVFYGESMFTLVPNASKFGFISLVKLLAKKSFRMIDCQQTTSHLKSLGAEDISRSRFLQILRLNLFEKTYVGNWKEYLK